jgi:hypothetical protein
MTWKATTLRLENQRAEPSYRGISRMEQSIAREEPQCGKYGRENYYYLNYYYFLSSAF